MYKKFVTVCQETFKFPNYMITWSIFSEILKYLFFPWQLRKTLLVREEKEDKHEEKKNKIRPEIFKSGVCLSIPCFILDFVHWTHLHNRSSSAWPTVNTYSLHSFFILTSYQSIWCSYKPPLKAILHGQRPWLGMISKILFCTRFCTALHFHVIVC